ncbi:hypothetical protein AMECASPLE_033149, partial [Ameca splendens]
STPKYNEPAEMNTDGGWGEDEFDDEEFDDDYESPYSDDEDERDYESPNEEQDPDRTDNNMSTRGPPPVLCPRPPNSTLSAPTGRMPGESLSRRDPSPHGAGRPPGNFPSGPPKVCRDSKPGRDSRNTRSPVRGKTRTQTACWMTS